MQYWGKYYASWDTNRGVMPTRTTVSLDEEDLEDAKEQGINISQAARMGIQQKLDQPTYHLFNTNKKHLPKGQTGAGVYGRGVVATFADSNYPDHVERYGNHIAKVEADDGIFSWQNKIGIRCFGIALEDGSADPVPPEQRLFHSPSSDIHEFHVSVAWLPPLRPSEAPYTNEVKRICGSKIWAKVTYRELNDDHRPELLRDVIKGRALS